MKETNEQEVLHALENPRPVGSDGFDPSVRLQALVERSRGIVLPKIEGSTIRLSKFTKKQLSRANKVRPGTVKRGRRLFKRKRKRHHLTTRRVRREWQREYHRSPRRKFWELRKKKGEDWQVREDEWNEIWDLLGGCTSFEVRRYEEDKPFTKYNLYIYRRSDKHKLYEGKEEELRDIGAIL
jgi:hypothetical protein